MAEIIRMPRMSDTMEEGVIVEWYKKPGDKVKSGDILADVETDKATMELENYEEGELLYVGVKKGDSVPVNAILAIVGESGEDISGLLKEESSSPKAASEPEKEKPAPAQDAAPAEKTTPLNGETIAATTDGNRIKASPLARKIAAENSLDLRSIAGTGDEGRIVRKDVEKFLETAANQTLPTFSGIPASESFEEKPVSQMRKAIARRLSESKFNAPHFYLTVDVDMDRAVEARAKLNEVSPVKISFNDIVIRASAAALRQHPAINAAWMGDKIRYNNHIHIGMAVAVEDGLIVPVIRFADQKSFTEIAAQTRALAEKAQQKKLQPEEYQGNTFTISNLGMFGIEEFTAIINSPDACILAVGAIREEPVVKNGAIVPGSRMKLTLSCDHRVVDGATGAKFLKTLKEFLEEPLRILL